MDELQKSYYAIIPANVRYDNDLTPNAKLIAGLVIITLQSYIRYLRNLFQNG